MKLDIRTRKESYVTILPKEKAKLAYRDVEEAVKKSPFKLDDALWGTPPAKAKKK